MKEAQVVAFIADRSGTGKTTLIAGVVRLLKKAGYRVATVKHALHDVQVDRKGSDSWRHAQAGSDICVLAGPGVLATIMKKDRPSLDDALAQVPQGVDIILAEGFKDAPVAKIEVYRHGHSRRLLCEDPEGAGPGIMAVASSVPLDIGIPVLSLDDHVQVCNFIMEHFLNNRIET